MRDTGTRIPRRGRARRALGLAATALLALLAGAVLLSCARRDKTRMDETYQYESLYNATERENELLAKMRERERRGLQQPAPEEPTALEPMVPTYNPLEEETIYITMRDKPLHDVLFVVARTAGLNLVIEPGISLDNRVTISFEAAKCSTVVETLLKAYDLAWEVRDNVLYVERFSERTFDLGFINSSTSVSMSAGGDIFGAALSGSGSNLSSSFALNNSYSGGVEAESLYGRLSQTVAQILGAEAGADAETGEYFSLDPVSGTLKVRSTPRRIRAVSSVVADLKRKLARQVVIDARILEVRLSEDFQLGVDWSYVTQRLIDGELTNISFGHTAGSGLEEITISQQGISADTGADTTSSQALSTTINALETFGSVRSLSNPHVRTRHGQPTLLTSGTSYRYVSEITRDEEEEGGDTSFTINTATAFDGIMLGVIPFINEDGTVDIQVFPIQSNVDETSLDPVEVVAQTGEKISLVRTEVKNVATNVRVRDNSVIILGGLIDKGVNNTDSQVPGAGDVPFLGWLFKQRNDSEEIRELVIIMNIRIVG
jgi:MSHA type pilus biogenesis protein MshL